MHAGCVICGELFTSSADVAATPCGHTFHTLCIIQWIERSKSCPQCRAKATEKSLIKLFFDSGGLDSSTIDPNTLQNHVDSLKFQVRIKDQEISKYKESNSTFIKQNRGLKEECKKLELTLRDKETTNIALKTQLKYMDQFKTDAQKAKESVKNLRSQLDVLQNVEMIVSGTNKDVESMLMSYSTEPESMRSLATFCSILKKELNKTSDDKKRFRDEASSLRMKIKDLRHTCNGAVNKMEKTDQVNKLLQDDVISLERENSSLTKKVEALQAAISSPSGNVKNSALHRLIAESPAPEHLKRPHYSSIEEEIAVVTPEVVRKMCRREEVSPDNSIEYLGSTSFSPQKKEKNVMPDRRPLAVTTNTCPSKPSHSRHDIFQKGKPALINFGIGHKANSSSQSGSDQIGYDGFGGHHKVDEFPRPRPIFLKKKSGVKVLVKGGLSGKTQKKTLINFFQNPFDDSL